VNEDARQFRALLKLRAVARRHSESAARNLAELERTRSSALLSLDRLESTVRTEEAAALKHSNGGFRELAAYLDGVSVKRAALLQSCRSLETEIASACEALVEAEIERRKLDFLVDQYGARSRKRRQKQEGDLLDDAGRRLQRRLRTTGG
jgi:flagellar export protein FliJ